MQTLWHLMTHRIHRPMTPSRLAASGLVLGIALSLLVAVLLPYGALAAPPVPGEPNAPACNSKVKILKFEDRDGNGIQGAIEPSLAGWRFLLSMKQGDAWVQVGDGVTGADGRLTFSGLQVGDYQVEEQSQPGYVNTTPLLRQFHLGCNDARIFKFGNRMLLDYGDLPDGSSGGSVTYNLTRYADDGARHVPGDLFLGSGVDLEADGQPTQLASGDDLSNSDDEDGGVRIATPPDFWKNGEGKVEVTVTGGPGCLTAWLDFWDSNANTVGTDGDFDDVDPNGAWSEVIINNLSVAGTQIIAFPLPLDAATYPMFARFRLIPAMGDGRCEDQPPAQLTGLVINGEVEDYYFNFKTTALALQGFTASSPLEANRAAFLLLPLLGIGMLALQWSSRRRKA